MSAKLTAWLGRQNQIVLSLYAIFGAFITYFSMYAFRKPLSAGTFEALEIWGIDYKVIALISQVVGYALSKFIGIKVISELTDERRAKSILMLIGFAWVSLLLFGLTPTPYNLLFLFLNGLPLGMIWGVVFSYLEGRRYTELMGAGLCASFIVASGIVKSVGRSLVLDYSVSEFWMPFMTGLIFIPTLIVGTMMLAHLPAPSKEDEADRTERVPMNGASRKSFFKSFRFGIIVVVAIYVLLTVFRDIRDNFMVEIWSALGYGEEPMILATAELPVAISVLLIIASMSLVRGHRLAFYLNFAIIILTGLLLVGSTLAFLSGVLNPALWMIVNGFSMYLAYIAFHTFLYERWIALFRRRSNIGYLMYISDAFGYIGSIGVMVMKSLLDVELSWFEFFITLAFVTGGATTLLGIVSFIYFRNKEEQLHRETLIEEQKYV